MSLELRALEKRFGSTHAVCPLDLTIKAGEFFSLLGPSGCGKTTLLRMLGGFEQPTSGEIRLENQRIDTLPANQRPFNMVFQRYALFPHLDVSRNVAFGLEMKGVARPEIESRVAEALSLVRMESFAARGIGTLSGGQQQRVALARALINRPKVLLLDEPLSALDLKLRQQMQVELQSLQRKTGHTFIFVTHDQEEALTLSDRIAVMNAGVVEQVGTPQEIYEYPRTRFVARFIGQINSLEGQVREAGAGEIAVDCAGAKRALVVKPSRDGTRPLPQTTAGARVSVLMRPEKLKLMKSAPGGGENWVDGTLKSVLYQGPVTQYFVGVADAASDIIVTAANSAVTARKNFAVGDKVHVAWSPEDCLLMAAEQA